MKVQNTNEGVPAMDAKSGFPKKIDNLSSQYIKNVGEHEFQNGHKVSILEVCDYNALNQLIGYAKFINAPYGNVFYRGEAQLHKALLPGAFRRSKPKKCEESVNRVIRHMLEDQDFSNVAKLSELKKKNGKLVAEALLQQYGYNTRFVDVVDNHWVALWFGLNNYNVIEHPIKCSKYTRRAIKPCDLFLNKCDPESIYQYMLMVAVDNNVEPLERGIYVGNDTIAIDLRLALPSIFLRPHAQHGIVIRKQTQLPSSKETMDLAANVVGIVRLRIDDVISWLGMGDLLSSSNLFPSPVYDYGYKVLLERADLFENENGCSITKYI